MTHVLIADDEAHTRLSLSFILESAGYLVTDAPDGQEAREKILALRRTSHPIDLLVLDIEMPGLTGRELLDELAEQNIFLPTVIITGFGDSSTCGMFSEKRHVEFIAKPFNPQRLTTSVTNLLQDKKQSGLGGKCESPSSIIYHCPIQEYRLSDGYRSPAPEDCQAHQEGSRGGVNQRARRDDPPCGRVGCQGIMKVKTPLNGL
jgi:CheY-like chemotaxis protein